MNNMNYLAYIDYHINQFGHPVPDEKAMRKFSHDKYIGVNKDWIPRSRLSNESFILCLERVINDGLYIQDDKVKVRYGKQKFGDPIELLMGKGKNKVPYEKTVGGHKVYASYVVSLTSESGDVSDAKEILYALKGKTRSKSLSISPEELESFIKRTAVHLWSMVPDMDKTDLVVTIKSSSDFGKRLAKELAAKSSDKTMLYSPDSIVKAKIENIKIADAPNDVVRRMLEQVVDRIKKNQSFEMKKVPGKLRHFVYDFLEIDPKLVKKIEGRNVVLVDDYLITGTTIAESFRLIDFLAPASLKGVTYFKLQ